MYLENSRTAGPIRFGCLLYLCVNWFHFHCAISMRYSWWNCITNTHIGRTDSILNFYRRLKEMEWVEPMFGMTVYVWRVQTIYRYHCFAGGWSGCAVLDFAWWICKQRLLELVYNSEVCWKQAHSWSLLWSYVFRKKFLWKDSNKNSQKFVIGNRPNVYFSAK